jgi:hypothetical protein
MEDSNVPWGPATTTLMNTDRKADDLFRQHSRILQTSRRRLEQREKCSTKVQQPHRSRSAFATLYELLTCASDLQRSLCLQMVRRRSADQPVYLTGRHVDDDAAPHGRLRPGQSWRDVIAEPGADQAADAIEILWLLVPQNADRPPVLGQDVLEAAETGVP